MLKEPKLCVSQVVGRWVCVQGSGGSGWIGRLKNPIKLIKAAEGNAKAVYLELERRLGGVVTLDHPLHPPTVASPTGDVSSHTQTDTYCTNLQ